MARLAHWLQSVGFASFSIGIHLLLLSLFVVGAVPTASKRDQSMEWIDVDIQPALGQPHGSDKGKGLGSHVARPRPVAPPPIQASPPPVLPPPDPDAIPTASSSAPPPVDAGPPTDNPDAGDAAAMTDAMSAGDAPFDPTTPIGSENVGPGFGSPDGVEGGQGTSKPKPHVSPQYRAILAAWFHARFSVAGLNIPPEERKKLVVTASVSISSDRRVVGFSLSGTSGNAAFDERVRSSLQSMQGSGAQLPAPPPGDSPPEHFATRFRWQ